LHHKVQKFSSGTGSPGWSRKKGRKTVVVLDSSCCDKKPTFYLNIVSPVKCEGLGIFLIKDSEGQRWPRPKQH